MGKAQVRRGAEGGKGEEWKAVGHCHWIHASTHSLPHPLCQTHIFNVQKWLEKVKRKCELVQKSCQMSTDFFIRLLNFQLCKVLLRHSGLGRQDLVWTVFKLSAESNFGAVARIESESSGFRNLLRKHRNISKAKFVGVFCHNSAFLGLAVDFLEQIQTVSSHCQQMLSPVVWGLEMPRFWLLRSEFNAGEILSCVQILQFTMIKTRELLTFWPCG